MKFREILAAFDYEHVYTDASNDGSAVAAALSRLGTRVNRMPNESSIFSGEARATLLPLDMAEQDGSKFIHVFSEH